MAMKRGSLHNVEGRLQTVMSMVVHSSTYPVLMMTEYHTELIIQIITKNYYSVWQMNVHVYWAADSCNVSLVVVIAKLH